MTEDLDPKALDPSVRAEIGRIRALFSPSAGDREDLITYAKEVASLRASLPAQADVTGEVVKPLDEEWDGLDCYCGGGWKVGHAAGCPEGNDLATTIATAVMRWAAPHLKHIVSFNVLRDCIAAELPASPPAPLRRVRERPPLVIADDDPPAPLQEGWVKDARRALGGNDG
jgi:hypothetical protein